ncbi:MAG TPA: beta-ketoacyl synthase N-terminal-like domain-containing protein [Longimicrobium sp.]|nr:beta-ketoacyl synthase N-terminal-like domain-containing protein [Longimicrobium sp.]
MSPQVHEMDQAENNASEFDVAVVGMSARFPGADDLAAFWSNLRGGVESITLFTPDELRAAGVPESLVRHADYVPAIGRLRDVESFDAAFFGYAPREAETLEPAHRIFLECAWEALEDAACDPEQFAGSVGVYAGAGGTHYADRHVRSNPELVSAVGDFHVTLGSAKDFIATRTSYKLDLRGPSLTVQTGCSTSLVAVHLAAQSLLRGECDLALAGGANVIVPQVTGYMYAPGGISSPDGHCRPFDARSAGTLSGSGVGVVVLKRLADAIRDGDPVRAVIRGSAINNDGAAKVAFTAPGVEGQSAVIGEALAAADVDADTIRYVEAHGSGTDLGDTIEIAALTRAYRARTDREAFCAIGSVKSNVGHLDTAAGAAGFIKTVLAVQHGEIPPTVHFTEPNPRIPFAGSPFFVAAGAARAWPTDALPRRAAVSSFGIGGTNAHVILEEAPAPAPSGPSRPWQLLTLSARTPAALDAATDRLADYLAANPEAPLADVAFTLREGRHAFAHRRVLAVHESENVPAILRARTPDRVATSAADAGSRSVVFLFPGVGDHYPNMARGLYESEPVFRAEVDRCCALLESHLGMDLREVLFPGNAPSDAPAPAAGIDLRRMLRRDEPEADPATERINRTEMAQPAVFVVEYALSRLWASWGIVPDAVIGHSLGEYTAACVAGVLGLEEALALVADRARMIGELPGGAMLAVPLDPASVSSYLVNGVGIATSNAPSLTVVSGPDEAVAEVERRLAAAGHTARRLAATHAFHSTMMEPVADRLAARVGRARLRPPRIPMISNVTGTWIADAEATDPGYWVRHLLGTVRFAEGMEEILGESGRVLLEVGPGQTLSTFVRQRPADGSAPPATIPSLRYNYDRRPDSAFILEALGRLWAAGIAPDWKALRGDERRLRLRLPTYPWERQRFWIEAREIVSGLAPDRGRRADATRWTYLPTWSRTSAAPAATANQRILVVGDAEGVASALAAAGHDVTVARPGDRFGGSGNAYTLRPDSRDDFRSLADRLDGRAPETIVYVPTAGGADGGFGTLLLVAETFGYDPGRLVVLTVGAQEVTGDEELNVAAAALVGACVVIPQEYPTLGCRVVDVPSASFDAKRVAAEVVSGAEEPLVAYRGRHRWTRGFGAVVAPAEAPMLVREGGAYLLIGNLAGRNGGIGAALGATPGVRLAAIDTHPPAAQAEVLETLQARGTELVSVTADPTDATALAAAVREVEEHYGRLDGVIYSPEIPGELAGIAEVKPAEWGAQMAAVVRGAEALEAALGGRDLDFCLIESSLGPVVGSVARVRTVAAHAVIDGFATRHNRGAGAAWTSVGWDRWSGAGESGDGRGIDPADVPAAVDAVLRLAGEAQIWVSTTELTERARAAARPASEQGSSAAATHARPNLDTDYHAPENEVEEQIAAMWQELLGISRIGIHDDFFGLGGHSLFATQIISRVRDTFQLELPLKAIFEAPTIARLAVLIEDAIMAEIESLSDEEALSLAGEG